MVIAVDFDGTIVEHQYPAIGKPIPFAIDVLKRLQAEGHTLVLWTFRHGQLLQEAIDYCEANELGMYAYNKNYPEEEYSEEVPRKLSADIFIDDRNIGGLLDWGVVYNILKSGQNSIDVLTMMNEDRPKRKRNWFIRIGEAWERARGRNY